MMFEKVQYFRYAVFNFTEKKDIVFSKPFCFCCRTAPIESPEASVFRESVLVLSLEM